KDIYTAEMATASLPVTSVKNWGTYVNILSATPSIQRAPWGVSTKIMVKPDLKTQFKVSFDFNTNLSDEFLGAVYSKVPIAENLLFTPYDLTPPEERESEPEESKGKKKKY